VKSRKELLLNQEDAAEVLSHLSNKLQFAIKDYLIQ